MSRLIDADALSRIVKLAWDTSDSEDFEKSVFIAIATAPTIDPVKWIPVCEGLPKKCKYYLVTDFGAVEEAYFDSDRRWWSLQGNKLKGVTAWMPLPEPWRGEEDETD